MEISKNVILRSAVAAALGLAALNVSAGTTAYTPTTYAIEGIPASGDVTIPGGILYTTAAGAAESGLLAIKLPSGVTFVSTPSLTVATEVTAATVAGGGAGSNTLTISYDRTANAGGTITLGAFQVTGATALAGVTKAGDFQYSAQSSGFATAGNNDEKAQKADLALSDRQLIVTPVDGELIINVPSPGNATRWKAGGNTIATSGSASNLTVNNGVFSNSTATGAFTFSSKTATANIGGNFSGVTAAYLAEASEACKATAPSGSTKGTVTSSSISFSGITPSGTPREVCLIADSDAILQQTLSGITASATQDTFTTTPSGKLASVKYNGGVFSLDYVVGSSDGNYIIYINVVNRDSAATDVRAVVQSAEGTVNSGLLGTLPANQQMLYTMSDVNTATGSNLSSATDRGALTILTNTSNATANSLMFNPNGTVVTMPSTLISK